mmetsp:Transcript_4755/g.8136  ORF Transcript_4755/g.8136 Transcript_4755/m.8136 type:complete len:162 (+) Transcript_4755:983-1468(+)
MKIHLNLQKIHRLAEKVGGSDHHLKYIQVPINVLMPEAFCEPWQQFEGADAVTREKMLVAACNELNLNLVSSQPLLQGMCSNIPLSRESTGGIYNLSARHLQFIRSIPSKCLKSTVVGMKQMENVRANLEVISKPILSREEFFEALGPYRRQPFVGEEMDF